MKEIILLVITYLVPIIITGACIYTLFKKKWAYFFMSYIAMGLMLLLW